LRDGLALDVFDRREERKPNFHGLYKLKVVETLSPTDTFELMVVPTKHYALAQALGEIVPRAETADFLLLTQNWRGTKEIDSILPRSRYVYAHAKAGGTFSEGARLQRSGR
jgi:ketopantoate reductase